MAVLFLRILIFPILLAVSECRLSHSLNRFFIFGACLFWHDTCPLSSLSGNSVIAVDLFFVILLSHSFSFILPFKGHLFYILPMQLGTIFVQFHVSSFSCGLFGYIYLTYLISFWFCSPMSTTAEYDWLLLQWDKLWQHISRLFEDPPSK